MRWTSWWRSNGSDDLRSVRFGYNPNSSSLGADVTGLLLAGGLAMLIAAAISVWVRLAARFGRGEKHGVDS